MKRTILFFIISILMTLPTTLFASDGKASKEKKLVDINDYTCRDILLATGEERDLAIMFIQGYFVGKSGKTTFDRDQLAEATDRFLDLCLDDPKRLPVKTMAKALKDS